MMKTTLLSIPFFLFSIQSVYANTTEQDIKQKCAQVKQYAQLGKKFYDQKQYSKALEQFKDQAAWSSFCLYNQDISGTKLTENDVVIANNNVGLTYAKLNKPQWARAWYLKDKEAKSSQFNLSQLPQPKLSTDLSGTYVSSAGFGQWNTIKVSKKKTSYDLSFEGLYFPPYGLISGPNLGEFDTSMSLKQKHATYQYEDCKITLDFKFKPAEGHVITVKQNESQSGCGFGHNVWASGQYLKVEK
ncbi:hypothetical protein [Acinetobacter shaoyimingii]|uniref:hypothetical protein n=1 Tax=Acinetobacter shaoyimingii TaxID=2715164 RepID=UPI003877F49B